MHKLAIALLVSAVLDRQRCGQQGSHSNQHLLQGQNRQPVPCQRAAYRSQSRQQGWRSYRHDQRPDRRPGKSDRRNDTGGGWFPGDRREEDRRAHGSTEDFLRRRKDQHHSGQCHQGGVERGPCLPTSAAGQEITVVIENSGAISGSGFRDGCPGLNRERASPNRPLRAPSGKEPSLPRQLWPGPLPPASRQHRGIA